MSTAGAPSPHPAHPPVVVVDGLRLSPARGSAGGGFVLHVARLVLEPGVTVVLGPNGAGKTTLLRALATVARPDSGTLHVAGHDTAAPGGAVAARRLLGHLPQPDPLLGRLRAFDYLDVVAVLRELGTRRARHAHVVRALRTVGLQDVAARRARHLSGGERRRLALAAALLADPPYLVLDEPFAGLDPEHRHRLGEVLVNRRGHVTAVVSTHDADEAAAFADRFVVLRAGTVAFDGPPDALARVAAGRVWESPAPPVEPARGWSTGPHRWRCIGLAPPGAHLVEPRPSDGYAIVSTT